MSNYMVYRHMLSKTVPNKATPLYCDCFENKLFVQCSVADKSCSLLNIKGFKKSPAGLMRAGLYKRWRRHTLPGYPSTICAGRLNDSVRNGKRWTLPL